MFASSSHSKVLIISSVASPVPGAPSNEQKNVKKSVQLQESSGADLVFKHLKPADWHAAASLLRTMKDFSPYQQANNPLHVTDLGGGEGRMLEYLLTLSTKTILNGNEPVETLRAQYLKRAHASNLADRLKLGFFTAADVKMENISQMPKADIILACHSLYYNTRLWNQPHIDLKDHLFTKFLSWLKEEGLLCIILQSTASTDIIGANGVALTNLDALEQEIYPLINDSKDSHANYATAEMLEKAVQDFSKKLALQTGRRIIFKVSDPIICCIDLGNVKFVPDPQQHGKYVQPDEKTKKTFDFYTRNCYSGSTPCKKPWSAEKQKKFLDLIETKCKTVNGQYVITHVNKAIAIQEIAEPLKPQPLRAKL